MRGSASGWVACLLLVVGAMGQVAVPCVAEAAGYEGAFQRGLFYLERGATYGPDAVRSLERARDADPQRAGADPRWRAAAARAYAVTGRYTEAYELVERSLERDPDDERAADLREWLLGEAGLGRLWLVSRVQVHVVARLTLVAGARLDVAARKTLERLNRWLARGVRVGPEGRALLVPEGRYALSVEPDPSLYAPTEPLDVEIWAGDEARSRLVPRYPAPPDLRVVEGPRSVTLEWPPLGDSTYHVSRLGPDGAETVCEVATPRCEVVGLAVGRAVRFRLEVLASGGEVVAASVVEARTVAPVTAVAVGAELRSDLRVEVGWALGDGAADRIRVIREDREGEVEVAELDGTTHREDSVFDVPVMPGDRPASRRYRVEAWLEGGDAPCAVAGIEVAIPARVERVSEVAETLDRGSVGVVWETLPRDGLAEGYVIYRQKTPGETAQRVGTVADPFAREFYYEVADPLTASNWRHFVVPYLGDRLILDPEWVRVRSGASPESFDKRARHNAVLPDLGVSWDPYPGALRYSIVLSGEGSVLDERIVEKPYADLSGLQNRLSGAARTVRVEAWLAGGQRVEVLSMQVRYADYPRSGEGEE